MNELTNDQMKALFKRHKAALTRAKKKGPQAVIETVDAAFADWDKYLPAWPDNWRLWQSAKDDANYAIQRHIR
ncbi:MAG: hypothetical protein M0R32_05825 [Candidatus Cloacimonetes bacterium]|jgi:hypothetical protein|nr:hypothetical protein [Candidatus Cloacimonadota bacterium]